MKTANSQIPQQVDERAESDSATKAVVDDAMRIDVLGPNICKLLREHSPTQEELKTILIKLVNSDTEVRTALSKQTEDQALTNKGKGLTQIQTILLTAAITAIGTLIGAAAFNSFASSLNSSINKPAGVAH